MENVISKDGTVISFDRLGNGQPIILVDGALCSRAFGPLPKLARLLAKEMMVIHYDRRGRNASGDTKPYAMDREIEDLSALLNAAGGSSFVFGISSGAALALAAAAGGLPIRKLALYEPPFMVAKTPHRSPDQFETTLNRMIASNLRAEAVRFFMKDMVGIPSVIVFAMQLLPVWPKVKAVAHTLPYDAAIMGDFTIPISRTAQVNIPTWVGAGEKSPSWMRASAKQLADSLSDHELNILRGQTHNISAKILAPLLIKFFVG